MIQKRQGARINQSLKLVRSNHNDQLRQVAASIFDCIGRMIQERGGGVMARSPLIGRGELIIPLGRQRPHRSFPPRDAVNLMHRLAPGNVAVRHYRACWVCPGFFFGAIFGPCVFRT